MTDRGPGRPELVVLLDPDGTPIGTADKATVHGPDTPLHLAFSVHVTDGAGRWLVTRRALAKRTWPGVWSNAFCGHPAPGEPMAEAIARRAAEELGLELTGLRRVLPDFRYRATDASSVVEHEICPVWVARAGRDPRPVPEEVAEWAWAPAPALVRMAAETPWALSPWAVEQLPLLDRAGALSD